LAGNDRTREQESNSSGAPSGWKVDWKEPSIVLAAIGVIIALLAFGRDLFAVEISTGSTTPPSAETTTATATAQPTSTPTSTSTSSSPPSTTAPPAAAGRALTELTLVAGGSNLQRVAGTTTFKLPCATNSGDDLFRAVKFAVPRRDAAGLSAQARPDGIDDDVEVAVRVDNLEARRVSLRPGQGSVAVSAEVAGGTTLELRLTCNRPGGMVIFSDAVLTK
jgi:hypothetical protein